MYLRDAMITVLSTKDYGIQTRQGVSVYWDANENKYNVYEENKEAADTYFRDVDSAVDYFLKITEDDRLSRTEEEIELGLPGPLD
jgi:hypothetical protein